MEKKLNLGCGDIIPEGWINVDYAWGAKLAKVPLLNKLGVTNLNWDKKIIIHNLLKPFPWDTESIDVVYSSHTLEHFTREDGFGFLKECHRVLKTGGIIRIIVPDLKAFTLKYLEGKTRADYFVENLLVLYPTSKNLLNKILMSYISFPHKCMYDTPTLVAILKSIGFNAEEKKGFDSLITDIKNIEISSRTENSVIVEGIK